MKIVRLVAEGVHGYLPLDIMFYEDLTFLTGLNGSGKTSALRLLMALLTPNLEELVSITFEVASVTIKDKDDEIVVEATKTPERVVLRVLPSNEMLTIGSAELELLADYRRRDDTRAPLIERYQSNSLLVRLKQISTPMFLGLDRRFYTPMMSSDDGGEARRRELMARRLWAEDASSKGTGTASLAEVNYLATTRMQEVRAAQEVLDDELRAQFFTKAFEYKPFQFEPKTEPPTRSDIEGYRRQLQMLESAAGDLQIPIPEIQSALMAFIERISSAVESMEQTAVRGKKGGIEHVTANVFEWIVNKPQADRILEHLRMLQDYLTKREALRDPIQRFLHLLNGFLAQSRKGVSVTANGQLAVTIAGKEESKPITALSSGERQILVMLAHLSLNPNLAGSGVFIVDEPELSLHIAWQERFVDAIREANPKVQLILATHSPAIILDRVDSCRSLDGDAND